MSSRLLISGPTILILIAVTLAFPPARPIADQPAATFSKDVAPIFSSHCTKCHSEGQIAARVPLTSYEAAAPFADKIKGMVVTRRMPPWPADPERSVEFRNDARLSQHDIDTVAAWVNAGAPNGDAADVSRKAKPKEEWPNPEGRGPDLIVSLPGLVHLPPTGTIPYARWLVKVPLAEDKWVIASQTRPGNSAVVHHMAITEIALDEGMSPKDIDRLAGAAKEMGLSTALVGARPAVQSPESTAGFDMLGMYAPGTTLEVYEDGAAKLLKGGSNMYLNFNMHYQTTGKPETDQSMLALWFSKSPPKYQLFRVPTPADTIIANGKELLTDTPGTKAEGTDVAIPPIPANAEKFELTGVWALTSPLTLYQFQPHAHYRAVDFTYSVVYPDGKEQTLLTVPRYDHRWQMAYDLKTPMKLPAGSKLVVTAHYDNSTRNMHNPAPDKAVYFRDQNQSWDEMFSPFIQFAVERARQQSAEKQAAEAIKLKVVEVVGCLDESAQKRWIISKASAPTVSTTQSTTSGALNAAKGKALGSGRIWLLGPEAFGTANMKGQRVAAKGVLIGSGTDMRLNITSLQEIGGGCRR